MWDNSGVGYAAYKEGAVELLVDILSAGADAGAAAAMTTSYAALYGLADNTCHVTIHLEDPDFLC